MSMQIVEILSAISAVRMVAWIYFIMLFIAARYRSIYVFTSIGSSFDIPRLGIPQSAFPLRSLLYIDALVSPSDVFGAREVAQLLRILFSYIHR